MTILGVGVTITVIITDGPGPLGRVSILTITSVIAAIMVKAGIFLLVGAFIASLSLGILLGLLNGFMIAKVGIPSFISTYGPQLGGLRLRLHDPQRLRHL